MKNCAGIVLYNPNIERLDENIAAIAGQVDEILLVDNASENMSEIQEYLDRSAYKTTYIRNEKNEGIAKALNQILAFAEKREYPYFLTLDQDSVCNPDLIKSYEAFTGETVGQLTCRIIDTENGEVDGVDFRGRKTADVNYCITSGALNQTLALRQVGGFDEELFIDGVDLDVSLKLKKQGFHILKVDYFGIAHELGEKTEQGSGYRIKTANHSPWRNYYARRNLIYIARKYYKGIEKYKRILQQIAYGIGTVLLEDRKKDRIRYNAKGIIEGIRRPIQ